MILRERERVILKSCSDKDFDNALKNQNPKYYNHTTEYSIWLGGWDSIVNSYLNINILENNETLNSTIKNFADFYISGYGSLHKTYDEYTNISKENSDIFLLYYINGDVRNCARYYAYPSYRPQIIYKE